MRAAVIGVLAGAALAACGGEPPPARDEVARIGGEPVRWGEFEAYLERHAAEPDAAASDAVLSRLFERFLEERLLARLAVDRGVVETGAPAAAAVARLLDEAAATAVDADAVAAYYRDHQARFDRPARVRLRQLLLERRDQAELVVRALRAGEAFEDAARRAGVEPWGAGGEVLTRDDLPPSYVDVIFGLAVGEVSEPVAADYGFHVFQALETLPAERIPLEQAAPEIRRILRRKTADAAFRRLVREARDRYNPRVFEGNLPFEQPGAAGERPPPSDPR